MSKTSYTICHLTTVHDAFDDRIYHKELIALAKKYSVCLIAPAEFFIPESEIKLFTIKRINIRILRIFISPLMAMFKVLKLKPQVIHFHDPEFIPFAVLLKFLRFKIVYDIHELYHQQILIKDWIPAIFRRLFAIFYNCLERIMVILSDAIVLASSGMSQYYQKKYPNYYNRKFVVVNNFPILNFTETKTTRHIKDKHFTLIYTGGLSKIRGIAEIIKALDKIDNVKLILLGKWESEEFYNYCKNLKGYDKVEYLGYVPFNKIPEYLIKADVGICLLHDTENHKISIPIKILEYFSYGLPVIASNFEFWKQIFNDACVYVDYKNIDEIANAISALMMDKSMYIYKSNIAYSIVKNELNWRNEETKLLKLYSKLLN